jgi:hypothetical protein
MEGINMRLNNVEIRCPYCRKKQTGLLPYYEELGLEKINGVNSTYNEAIPDYSKDWQKEHLNKIKDAYLKAPQFDKTYSLIESVLLQQHDHLSNLSTLFIKEVCNILAIKTQVVLASSLLDSQLQKNERNIDLCMQMSATTYLSGQGAKKYNDENVSAGNTFFNNKTFAFCNSCPSSFTRPLIVIMLLAKFPLGKSICAFTFTDSAIKKAKAIICNKQDLIFTFETINY